MKAPRVSLARNYLAILPFVVHMSATRSLETALRNYRTAQAATRSLPRYCVFTDALLQEIVSVKPTSVQELATIKGLGALRSTVYGPDIVAMVRQSLHDLARPATVMRSGLHRAPPAAVVMRHDRRRPRDHLQLRCLPPTARHRATLQVVESPVVRHTPRVPVNATAPQEPTEQVYILELAHGKVYVGKSKDVPRRLAQHKAGIGSAWTKLHPPTGVMLPRLGNVCGAGDCSERDELLRYMYLRGVHHVRGWRYCNTHLSQAELDDAEGNIRELFDLCRRCGHPGHFVTRCRAVYDRNGRPLR